LSILDIIIIVIILIGFILGYKDGFVRKLIGLIGFVLAVFIAIKFAASFGQIIESITGIEIYLSEIIAGIIIFLVVVFIFSVLKRYIHPFDKVNNFLNQLVGGLVGAIQILFFVSAFLIILNIFNVPGKKSKDNSFLYYKIYGIIPATIEYVSQYKAKPKEIIKDYIRDKDTLK
jgi:membrane protein required for colicin V production